MNRRKFLGLLGGAAILPAVAIPALKTQSPDQPMKMFRAAEFAPEDARFIWSGQIDNNLLVNIPISEFYPTLPAGTVWMGGNMQVSSNDVPPGTGAKIQALTGWWQVGYFAGATWNNDIHDPAIFPVSFQTFGDAAPLIRLKAWIQNTSVQTVNVTIQVFEIGLNRV